MLKHFITFLRFACQFFGFCLSNINQYVQVYNNSEETLGELPETGGMGVIPFVAAGGTVTVAATLLLVTKRRKKTL